MAVISQNQSDYLNGLLKAGGGNAAWARAQLQGSSVMPQADPALVAAHQAAADQFKANNWGPNGTANGLTESQNLANVINQPGNTVKNNLTPYLSNVLTQAARDSAPQSQVSSPQVQQPQFQAQQYQQPQQYQPQQQGQSATDLINSIYQSQLAAQQQQNKQNRDNLLAGISGQDALAHQSATQQLNNNDVMSTQNGRKINEMLANQGVQGGDSITANISNQTAQGQNANNINQNLTNSLNGNLAQRNAINNNANASDLAIMQNLQGQQSSNLLNDLYKSRDFGLQQAGVTGMYNGAPTMQQNQNNFSNGIQQGNLTGYYNGPQGQQQNGYGQNNNQQGYGQNQNAGMNGSYQNNGQGGRGYDPGFSMSGNPTNDTGFGMRSNFIGDGSRPGNGFQTGMGVSAGTRTLAGQQLDQQGQNQLFNQGIAQAGVTGQYNGAPTMAAGQQAFQDRLAYGNATGSFGNGQKTTQQQQIDMQKDPNSIDNQLKLAQATYYRDHGMYYAGGGSAGARGANGQQSANDVSAAALTELQQLDPSQYADYLNANAAFLTDKLGVKGYDTLKKSVLADSVASDKANGAQGKVDLAIRERAIAAAQKDPDFLTGKAKLKDLIPQYEAMYNN